MKSRDTGLARGLLAIVLVLAIPACDRELATDPATDPAAEPAAQAAVLRIEAVSPIEAAGTVGEKIEPVPTVIVRNDKGQVVSGAKVVFIRLSRSDAPDADAVTNSNVITDSRGFATPGAWKLGTITRVYALEARLVDPRYYRSDSGRRQHRR